MGQGRVHRLQGLAATKAGTGRPGWHVVSLPLRALQPTHTHLVAGGFSQPPVAGVKSPSGFNSEALLYFSSL